LRRDPAMGANAMRINDAINMHDLQKMAKKIVPRTIYQLLLAASEDEIALRRSTEDFENTQLVPKVLRGVEHRDISTTVFGVKYAAPFGISPMGTIGILRKNIELALARSAASAGIPMIISGASALSHEQVAEVAPGHVWSQLYAATDPGITEDLVRRAEACGAGALVWTVSQPIANKTDRLIHAGHGLPPRPSWPDTFEALLHPRWLSEYIRGGMIGLGNWRRYAPEGANDQEVHQFYLSQRNAMQTFRELETLRRLWKGPLVVKGVLRPDDARRIVEAGADGIIVSIHGGFGVDRTMTSIAMLPHVVDAVGSATTVMLDSGVRRGADIVSALALGAKFVFCGRAPLYGATAAMDAGAARAIDILKDETSRTMGLLGCRSVSELSRDLVYTVAGRVAPWAFEALNDKAGASRIHAA
jgi:(S)-mandelate dehydrogenase